MAGADTACVPARAGTILGVTRSPAPSFRLQRAEPWLRLSVPTLLGLFLLTLRVCGYFQIGNSRRDALAGAASEIEIVATLAALALGGAGDSASAETRLAAPARSPPAGAPPRLARALPAGAPPNGRMLLTASPAGEILAAHPPASLGPRLLSEILGEAQPLTLFGDRAGVMAIRLGNDAPALATVRGLPGSQGQIAVVHLTERLLSAWRMRTLSEVSLLAAAVFVILGLGGAYWLQASHARAADDVCDKVKRRIDSALSRGRCGLWDWDIARGRIYWSDSMYEMLGYGRRDEFLSFGEVNGLVHCEDGDLYSLADRLASSKASVIDHDFRIRSASGTWVWLRARAELMRDSDDAGQHLGGISVDITHQRAPPEYTG